jgi:hypothetical protein
MAIRLEATRRFEATSPVARYWLTRCAGFRVGGARKGTVEEVVSRSDPHVPELLVVRDVYRRREVPISEVEAVVPAEQLIVLGDPIPVREKRRRRRPLRTAARVAAEKTRPRAGRLAAATKRGAAAGGLALLALGRLSKSLALTVGRGAVVAATFGLVALRALAAFARASLAAAASYVAAYRARAEGTRRR